ncbi:MAG: DUF6371 domain-containing protein [Janthinobacterium lividum]
MAAISLQHQPDPAGATVWCYQQYTRHNGPAPAPGGGHNDWLVKLTRFCNNKGAPLPDVLDLVLTTAPEGHDTRKIAATVKGIYRREQEQHGCSPYTSASSAYGAMGKQCRLITNIPKKLLDPEISIPSEIVAASLKQYQHNMLARLLREHFGCGVAQELFERFRLGTSVFWPGACVFWLFDEQGRARGGQVVQYDETGHTVKFERPDGRKDRRARPIHVALLESHRRRNATPPTWLTAYAADGVPKSPCLFGLPQLALALEHQPVALVESAKTAILASPYLPQYVWLATMGLGMLTEERLSPIKNRRIVLFPDAGAYPRWNERATILRRKGFDITVSGGLEQCVTEEERRTGLDLADVFLREWRGYPPNWDEQEVANSYSIE